MNPNKQTYLRWTLLGLTAVMMLSFPLYHIYCYGNVLQNGTSYRIPCRPYDPYDPFSGRYVAIQPEVAYPSDYPSEYDWAKITKDEKGQLKVTEVTDMRPTEGDYLPVHFEDNLRRFYMNEKLAPIAEHATRRLQDEDGKTLSCELEIKVLNGRAVSKELYVNEMPIAEYCKKQM